MNLPASLSSLLETLEIVSDILKEASTSSPTNVWSLVRQIKAVKSALKDVEKEVIKFIGEENDEPLGMFTRSDDKTTSSPPKLVSQLTF